MTEKETDDTQNKLSIDILSMKSTVSLLVSN